MASCAAEARGKGLSASAVFDSLTRLASESAAIAVDVGNNAYSFGRYFEPCGQRVMMSGYLGSIGFAFPAAMGAWAATQDFEDHRHRQVISVSGDGGFGQYAMEFTTAVKSAKNRGPVNGLSGKPAWSIRPLPDWPGRVEGTALQSTSQTCWIRR